MRQKNQISPAYFFTGGLIIILTSLFVLSSCQKNKQADIIAKNDLQQVAELLKGKIDCGKLQNAATEDNFSYLEFNEGSKGIIIQLLPGDKSVNIPSLDHSCIITSGYGVVIKDPSTNSVLLLPRDDQESQHKFAEVELLFNRQALTAKVAGTTFINFNS